VQRCRSLLSVRCSCSSDTGSGAGSNRRDLLIGGAAAAFTAASLPARPALANNQPPASFGVTSRLEKQLASRVTAFHLPNGMRFVVVNRPDAPVVSINTYCSAGAWVEEDGQTGEL